MITNNKLINELDQQVRLTSQINELDQQVRLTSQINEFD